MHNSMLQVISTKQKLLNEYQGKIKYEEKSQNTSNNFNTSVTGDVIWNNF